MISGNKVFIRGIKQEDANKIYAWVNMEKLRQLTGPLYPISEYEHDEWMKNQFLNQNKKLFAV